MNYLAHAYLSFNDPAVLAGNLVSDFVKGKKKFDYPPGILKGINLHRAIDRFTDDHEATKKAREIFRPHYRLYSGAFVDILYDHFLASDAGEFSEDTLFAFSQNVYATIDNYREWLPAPFASMFPYMKRQNWLYNYRSLEGTRKSLGGLVHRAAYLAESDTAYHLFVMHYQPLREYYRQFWQDVKPFAKEQLDILRKT